MNTIKLLNDSALSMVAGGDGGAVAAPTTSLATSTNLMTSRIAITPSPAPRPVGQPGPVPGSIVGTALADAMVDANASQITVAPLDGSAGMTS